MGHSFAMDVLPLFRSKDLGCMKPLGAIRDSFDEASDATGNATHADHGNARDVPDRVDGTVVPRMSMDAAPWTADQIGVLRAWIEDGCTP